MAAAKLPRLIGPTFVLTRYGDNQPGDTRHDNVITQRSNDRIERTADDNANRQVEDITSHDKFLKFLYQFSHSDIHLP